MKLVLGSFGFLGSSIAKALSDNGMPVKVLDKFSGGIFKNSKFITDAIIGDVSDKFVLQKALKDVDTVLYFISQSYPSMNHPSLQFEIENTLSTLDNTLSIMHEMNVKNIIFPSSGGTIYGEVKNGTATENNTQEPQSAYGAGKFLCEEILKYYCRVHGMNATILRLSNVYGCPFYRKVQQGAVDIFIQKALSDEPIELWGDPSALIRDYLYIDDFIDAVISLLKNDINGAEIFNVASGTGHSLQDVLDCIETGLNKKINKAIKSGNYSGVGRNVLSIDKLTQKTGWTPKYTLEAGINHTIKNKTSML